MSVSDLTFVKLKNTSLALQCVCVVIAFLVHTGADLKKNDGIYSAYFTEFTDEGRYNVKVRFH